LADAIHSDPAVTIRFHNAMSQPSAKSNFIQIALITMVIFLGFQLFMGPRQNQSDPRTADQLWTEMQKLNGELKDVSIAQLLPLYTQKYRAEAQAKKVPEAEIEAQELRAHVLVADTKFKSGLQQTPEWNYHKINAAYTLLKPKFEAWHTKEIWRTATVPVAPDGDRVETEVSAAQVYDAMVDDLSVRNKDQRVYGLIPGYALIDALVALTGRVPAISYTFAAFLLAVVVRAIVWPLAQKQFMWGRQMSQLQPYIKEIQEKFKDKKTGQITDQQAMTAETMKLYSEYGINPFSGCGPALIQVPLFLTVYQCMLLYKFEFTKGTFLWIQPGATSFLGIPLAPNLGERDYILVFFYGVSMIVTTLMTPVSDPSNARQQRLMGISIAVIFSVMMFFWSIPSAFILYWIFTNILSTLQSYRAYRLPLPPLEKKVTGKGGVIPATVVNQANNGSVDPSFFGKTGTPKANKSKKKK